MKHVLNASEFKARCLAILDQVNRTGDEVVILKRGKEVARLLPPSPSSGKFSQQELMGKGAILGDILESVFPTEEWECLGS